LSLLFVDSSFLSNLLFTQPDAGSIYSSTILPLSYWFTLEKNDPIGKYLPKHAGV
jgi:hypothetical protein